MNTAFQYIMKAGGVLRGEDYPYTGIDGHCKFDKNKIAASVSNFSIVSIDEDQIAANLVKNGPLAGMQAFLPSPLLFLRLNDKLKRHQNNLKYVNITFFIFFLKK